MTFKIPVSLLLPLAVLVFAHYLGRWGIENCFRLKKIALKWASTQTPSLESVQHLNWLAMFALYWVMAFYRKHSQLINPLCNVLVLHERPIETLTVRYYRVIDLLRRLLIDPAEAHLPSSPDPVPPPGKAPATESHCQATLLTFASSKAQELLMIPAQNPPFPNKNPPHSSLSCHRLAIWPPSSRSTYRDLLK